MTMSNICEQCGGYLRIEYTLGFEQCRPNDIRWDVQESIPDKPIKLCPGHPNLEQEHNGKLGSADNIYLVKYMLKQIPNSTSVWIGRNTELRSDEIWLSPEQALSLLDWLRQEEDNLKRLVKDRGNNAS